MLLRGMRTFQVVVIQLLLALVTFQCTTTMTYTAASSASPSQSCQISYNHSSNQSNKSSPSSSQLKKKKPYGRISNNEYILTPQQIKDFHTNGCCTIPNVLTEAEVCVIEQTFDLFLNRQIHVPDKDFCDMSKPFDTPFEQWSIINCMLPTKYHPKLQNNIYEVLTKSIAQQLHPSIKMTKDYDQFLTKRCNKQDAIFSWHQDMAYWPGSKALSLEKDVTSTCTFSLAIDDSTEENGCLRYVPESHLQRTLRPHVPLHGDSRDDGHALTINLLPNEIVKLAPVSRGSLTIHNEYVVHGSSGNTSRTKQRRTYVIAYRPKVVVEAERTIGFTHSHNDDVNWDSFDDGEDHRMNSGLQTKVEGEVDNGT